MSLSNTVIPIARLESTEGTGSLLNQGNLGKSGNGLSLINISESQGIRLLPETIREK